MSVLAREQDSYQRALEAYQRQINRYNRGVDRYKSTLVKDQNGNLLVIDGSGNVSAVNSGGALIGASLPRGFDQTAYGATAIPGGQGYRQLRQNPTEAKRESVAGVRVYSDESGYTSYYDANGNPVYITPEWRRDRVNPATEYAPATYDYSRDVSSYMESPPEWKKTFDRKAPEATPAQVSKMNAPSLAEIESGLIGEVMKGKGVRYGVPVYRPRNE